MSMSRMQFRHAIQELESKIASGLNSKNTSTTKINHTNGSLTFNRCNTPITISVQNLTFKNIKLSINVIKL